MAKRVISEAYAFTPSTNTLVITGKWLRREQLILILNVTSNTVIYNFSSSSLTASTFTNAVVNGVEITTIQLAYNCSGMNVADKISIIVEEVNETFQPSETLMDPVGKLRVSQPQALIDTDFEYGVQSTKWETISLTNNRPSAFYDPTQGISNVSQVLSFYGSNTSAYQITAATGNGTRLVTLNMVNTTGITANTPIYVQDCTDPNANGWYLPNVVTGNVSVTYYARGNVTNGNIFDSTKTYVFVGAFYTNSAIPVSATSGAAITAYVSGATSAITMTTTYAHGLTIGQAIFVNGFTGLTTQPNGAWYVKTTPTSNTFTFDVPFAVGTGTAVATAGALQSVFPRTWGSSIHRAYDGGVTFSAGYPYHGNQLIRQTRRVFRYQSGKGIQFSTGSNLCSPWQVDNLTAVGTTVTVTTKFPHNAWIGAVIKVFGADQAAYNGTFTITGVTSDLAFTYTAGSSPTSPATTGSSFTAQPYQWYGAALRVGMFTSQNGFFFEYDGQTVSSVRRNSTTQLQGYISTLAQNTQNVTGVGTFWSKNLQVGDFIVIRGMSFRIQGIESDTSMTIYPDYRGVSIAAPSQVIVSKTIDTKTPQNSWAIDRMDGTGSSGFNLDVTKMQMWYMDYTWYGAGAIRWGFKNNRGEVNYCHRLVHGNQQTEAYMRTGNLPARYEVNTFYPITQLTATVLNTETTTINVTSTAGFPNTGWLIVTAAATANSGGISAAIEYIAYSGKTATTFSGLTRAITNLSGPGNIGGANMGGNGTAQTFTYSATAPIGVSYYGPMAANTISHWGSSVIMDGRYDDDKSLLFTAGMTSSIANIGAGATQPLISLRIAPSVDSGLTGTIGQREILNSMQLIMRSIGLYTTGTSMTFLVQLRLNGVLSGGTFTAAGGSSLAQVAYHTSGQTITGGEQVFGFYTTTPGIQYEDLGLVRDLGNSILGGGNSYAVPTTAQNKYPDGPDIITIAVTNITAVATNSVNARISWSEAQA